ncbi:Methylamine utilisation protein MauE domain-containing protein [Candidatus Magnetomoraceae bacterium gMMP-15]
MTTFFTTNKKWEWLYIILRVFLGVVFLWASWDKILYPKAFAEIIHNYKILPDSLINPIAVILPWIEAVCGFLLITGLWLRGSSLIINALLLIFIAALIFNMYRGLDIRCGCFSLSPDADREMLSPLIRDLALLSVSSLIFFKAVLSCRGNTSSKKYQTKEEI